MSWPILIIVPILWIVTWFVAVRKDAQDKQRDDISTYAKR